MYKFYLLCSVQKEPNHSCCSSEKRNEGQPNDFVLLRIFEIEEGEFCCEIIFESKKVRSLELSELNSVWDRIFWMGAILDKEWVGDVSTKELADMILDQNINLCQKDFPQITMQILY